MAEGSARRRGSKGRERQQHAMPLSEFPLSRRAKINALAKADKRPPRWLNLGLAQIESRAWYEWHWRRGRVPGIERDKLSPTQRAEVIARDGYLCGLCGGEVEPDDVHIDHIVPIARGGRDALENLQVAHSRCNLRKGARV